MKKIYLYGLLCIIGLFLCGCNQTSSEEPQKPIELEQKYYETRTWTEVDEAHWGIACIHIVLDKSFPHKVLTVEDFPELEIEELKWSTEKKYKKYLEEGNLPDDFRQSYDLILKNEEPNNYIEALEYLKELNYEFIKNVWLRTFFKTLKG
ncbi:MAG: hypothetical protein K2M08_06970 [Anaeroplasmataceae bacterium]|nr:hypothetical protein [Anaeroplasmataceae bacterium]